jgi:hypothetical protein
VAAVSAPAATKAEVHVQVRRVGVSAVSSVGLSRLFLVKGLARGLAVKRSTAGAIKVSPIGLVLPRLVI